MTRLLFILFLLTAGSVSARADDWHLVTLKQREYVPLQDFCKFYNFVYPGSNDGKTFTTHGPHGELRLTLESSVIRYNGVNYYLCFPIENSESGWLISRLDLAYLLDPILRPSRISDRRPFKGVVIDAGHGGADNGAFSARGKMEKTYTLDTAFRLEKLLRDDGIETVMTRRIDEFIPLEERAHYGDRYRDFLFVAIHFNSASQGARGLETYIETPRGAASTSSEGYLRLGDYQKVPGNGEDPLNALLGSEIHRQIVKLNPGDIEADRGLKRARFVVLKENSLPSVLVEGGFLTNPPEAATIDQPAYRQKLAGAIASGIENFMREMDPNAEPVAAATPVAIPKAAAVPHPTPPPERKVEPPPAPAAAEPPRTTPVIIYSTDDAPTAAPAPAPVEKSTPPAKTEPEPADDGQAQPNPPAEMAPGQPAPEQTPEQTEQNTNQP